jgi:flagellar basal body P-ring formation protein FlgA
MVDRFWIQARVEYRTAVPVVTRQLRGGQIIDSNRDVRWEERDITYLQDNPVSIDDLASLPMAASILNPGVILVRSNLQKEIAAHRGEELEVVAGNDDFKVSLRGTAEAQGYVGDLIKIKTTSGKTLSGTLVSKGVVRVQY